jgi:hypothetical protein
MMATGPVLLQDIQSRLEAIRAGAPSRSPNVRVLSAYSSNADCNLANLGFASRVDFDRLLANTPYQVSFGQSPFAFSRGTAFERMIAQRGYAATLELLRTGMGFSVADARVVSLRNIYPRNSRGMRLRAQQTRVLLRQLVTGRRSAPNLIDGGVLETIIGGIPARFEADALAARFGGPIHAGEVKSFPVVDGRADPEKLAAALNQVAIYILLTMQLVAELGGNPDLVSPMALLITPTNVGLRPILSVKDVSRHISRAQRLLSSVPDIRAITSGISPEVNFGLVADQAAEPARRIEALHQIADQIGTTYKPTCLSTCGNALFCRERAFHSGSPCLTGPQAVRLLPGVTSLGRAAELVDGAPPTRTETPVAAHLARAGRLYDAASRNLPNANAQRQRIAV